MVRRPAAQIEPAAPPDSAGADAAMRERKRVQHAPVEGALHVNRTHAPLSAADRQVPATVDGEARVVAKSLGKHGM